MPVLSITEGRGGIRFAQPDEAAPLVLARAHQFISRTRPPEKVATLGDHLRRRHLTLKPIQRQVAQHIGVGATCIHNWEPDRIASPQLATGDFLC